MALKVWELVSILLSALVGGMFWGPWLGLSRSIATFEPGVFLAIAHRMVRNFAAIMPIVMPTALLSTLPVLFLSYRERPKTFYLTLAGFALFIVALLVTMLIELPIANQFKTWTAATLPPDWQQIRDRWQGFHIVRVVAAIVGLALLVSGAIF